MSGLWQANITEQQGGVVPSPDTDRNMVVLGVTSSGSPGLYGPYLRSGALQSPLGYGDTCDAAGQAIDQRQTSGNTVAPIPVSVYKLAATTPGSYIASTLDVSGVAGTVVPATDNGTPYGTYRAAVRIVDDGNAGAGAPIGTTGIVYEWAADEVPTWSNPLNLGVATSITLPNTGAGFKLVSPPLVGSTDVSSSGLYGGSSTLDGLTLILTVDGANHTLTLDKSTNVATEAAFLAAIHTQWPTITATAPASAHHLTLTGASVITVGAGTANTLLGLTAGTFAGTLKTGDTWFVRTSPPLPSAADVDAAFAALAKNGRYYGIVAAAWPVDATMAGHLKSGLDTLRARNKITWGTFPVRTPDLSTSETEGAWATSIETAFAVGTFDDSRLVAWASYGWITDSATGRVYSRDGFAQWLADVLRVPLDVAPCCPHDQTSAGLRIWNDGTQVGHDEGPRGSVTGLSDDSLGSRFVSTVSTADPILGDAVQYSVPWTLASASDNIKTLMIRRVADAVERAALSAAIGEGGMALDYTAPDPNVPGDVYRLTPQSRNMLHATMFHAIGESAAAKFLQNADDSDPETGLVVIDEGITVAAGKLVSATYTINLGVEGVLISLNGTLKIKE